MYKEYADLETSEHLHHSQRLILQSKFIFFLRTYYSWILLLKAGSYHTTTTKALGLPITMPGHWCPLAHS